MNWASPFKETAKPKKEDDPLKDFKKPKCLISKGTAKSITGRKCDASACGWIERWIEQLIRENSYPPQLKSDDFISLLSKYFSPKDALAILERIRTEYKLAFRLVEEVDDDNFDELPEILLRDPEVLQFLPPNFLR
jgi:hypothetical protein